MKRMKRIAAGAASLAMVASMALSMPLGASAATAYDTTLATQTVSKSVSTDGTSANVTSETVNGTTTLKKVLRIDDTANIPSATFKFTTSAGTAIEATYDSTNNKLLTLPVLAGVNPQSITYKEVGANTDAKGFDNTKLFTPKASTTGSGTTSDVTLAYVAQAKASGDTTSHVGTTTVDATDDNVIINDTVTYTQDSTSVDAYYAIKEIQLDFSACGFTEPGIYRYIIEEDNTAVAGIGYDTNSKRTVDVYVNDYATWYNAQSDKTALTDPATLSSPKLVIAGYVMYVGDNISAPQATATGTGTTTALESGLTTDNDTNGSAVYGGANGFEPTGATKSEGFTNTYTTHKLTFKKVVTGNQGSKDKYFKFNVKFNETDKVDDNDIFIISQVTGESSYDKTVSAGSDTLTSNAPNNATIYTAANITKANTAMEHEVGEEGRKTTDYWYVTGAQLKTGHDFYLQDGQFITITGIRDTVGYTVKEFNEEYTPTITDGVTGSNAYDTVLGDSGSTELTKDLTHKAVGATAENYVTVSDTKLKKDAYETFTNDKTGTIPTGILLSVAAPAGVGAVVIGGIAYLIVKNKRREAEEE